MGLSPQGSISLLYAILSVDTHPGARSLVKNVMSISVSIRGFETTFYFAGHCYEKVKQETELLRDAIQNELKLDPVEKEVAVVYQGEPRPELPLRVVEIPRERPAWFSKNLLAPENTKS